MDIENTLENKMSLTRKWKDQEDNNEDKIYKFDYKWIFIVKNLDHLRKYILIGNINREVQRLIWKFRFILLVCIIHFPRKARENPSYEYLKEYLLTLGQFLNKII